MVAKSGAGWYLAPSLIALIAECDERWPNRDHASDGSIGNAEHAARTSDHNPDRSAGGIVRAVDVDVDGIDVQELLDATVRDDRAWYVIYNRRIASATDDGTPWDWEPYDGDPHTGHVHISIKHTTTAASDMSPWFKEDEMGLTPEQAAQLNRIELLGIAHAKADAARYSDEVARLEGLKTAEAQRYSDEVSRFNAVLAELHEDPESPA